MQTHVENDNKVTLPLCILCQRQVAGEQACSIEVVSRSYECVLCFGLLDPEYIIEVAKAVKKKLEETPYDASACTLALNLPVGQVLRETVVKRSRSDLSGILVSVPYKIRNIDAYLPKLREASGLRFALSTDLQLTITFENNEFNDYDTKFLLKHFPEVFQSGRKRKHNESHSCTKIKVEQILNRIKEDTAKEYNLLKPSRPCSFSISFERNPIFFAGRYCKFSRFLPQSPWSTEEKFAPREPGNSVSEKIVDLMKLKFGASEARFTASGREDMDVRMLGDGRPFVVELRNCHFTNSLNGIKYLDTLRQLQDEINKQSDIRVNSLVRVTREEVDELRIGEEEKKKHYVAYCYSTLPLSDEQLKNALNQLPVELFQKTPVRVLKRRTLLERSRLIHNMEIVRLDTHHFLVRLETQAGTYVKEFIHGDFGRTRPSLADILNVPQGEVDILELDVEKVDFDWPPVKSSPTVFK